MATLRIPLNCHRLLITSADIANPLTVGSKSQLTETSKLWAMVSCIFSGITYAATAGKSNLTLALVWFAGNMYPEIFLGKPYFFIDGLRCGSAAGLEGTVTLKLTDCLRSLKIVIDGHEVLLLFFICST